MRSVFEVFHNSSIVDTTPRVNHAGLAQLTADTAGTMIFVSSSASLSLRLISEPRMQMNDATGQPNTNLSDWSASNVFDTSTLSSALPSIATTHSPVPSLSAS